MFSKQDIEQLSAKGISREILDYQLLKFQTGFPFTRIVKSATLGDGLLGLSSGEQKSYAEFYDNLGADLNITRFIPASGAATRMFKDLFGLREKLSELEVGAQDQLVENDPLAKHFFNNLSRYPFYQDLDIKGGESKVEILDLLLSDSGLGYGSLPKGLLKFHHYESGSRTAFEEHLREAAGYCSQKDSVQMHFTVSPEHLPAFQSLREEIVPVIEKELKVHFNLEYSFQKDETDTVAVDLQNRPFRDQEGRLVFRPGGHGALLENLNQVEGDVIFISNIDNVAPESYHAERVHYKKVLGGVLLKTREKIHSFLRQLNSSVNHDEELISGLFRFIVKELCIEIPHDIKVAGYDIRKEWAIRHLDRPLRVCGMVKNEGEPGGGPFFVEDANGSISLQVVEKSQVNIDDADQNDLLNSATHFNPVDLVCSVRDPSGEKYDLIQYRDPETGFITSKSMLGKELKAQELPGLWNGAMAHWTTIFVEVPVMTFTPVKTVFDLIRPEHST